jgi:hypothetical protein
VYDLKTLLRHSNQNFVTIWIWLAQGLLKFDFHRLVVVVETHFFNLLVKLLLLVEVLIEVGLLVRRELILASLHLLNLLLLQELHGVVERCLLQLQLLKIFLLSPF